MKRLLLCTVSRVGVKSVNYFAAKEIKINYLLNIRCEFIPDRQV